MKIEWLVGWIFLAAVAGLSMWLSSFVVISGKHPLEASALAVVIGIAIRNLVTLPDIFSSGIRSAEKILVVGIVLMGASFDFSVLWGAGWKILAVIALTMVVGYCAVLVAAQRAGLSRAHGRLLAVGTTICGGTAVAVTAPLIGAKEEETSSAVTVIALWGVIALLIYPALAQALSISDFAFGVFAGTAIHSTPQVVGAAFTFSDTAGKVATAVKLVRNCFIAPVAMAHALFAHRAATASGASTGSPWRGVLKAFPWFLFAFFVMIWIRTKGIIDNPSAERLASVGRFLIVAGMAGVGLATSFASFRQAGWAPTLVGLVGALVVGLVSATAIFLVF